MSHGAIDAILRERRLAAMRAEEEQASHTSRHHGYDPNQPRVPKGRHDGGQWTSLEKDLSYASLRAAAAV